jgi:hypothetical protein
MAVGPFLVVEYPGTGLPLAEWTSKHKATADMLLQPMQDVAGDLQAKGTLLARGMDAGALAALGSLLDRHYAPHETIRQDVRRGEWLGRMHIHLDTLRRSPGARAVALNQHRFGPPWSHVDDGVVHMRMRVKDAADADTLLEDVRKELARQDGDAQATLQEISTHDYGVWEELVQASIGLRP